MRLAGGVSGASNGGEASAAVLAEKGA
jgi:hypothetical protein